jgi:hypothetical protein
MQGCGNPSSINEKETMYQIAAPTPFNNKDTIMPTPTTTPTENTTPVPANNMNDSEYTIKALLEQKAKEIINNNKIDLVDEYKITSSASGDLNLDNNPDLGVVVEKSPGNQLGLRTLYILIKNNDGSYKIKHSNSNIILGRQEGGVWGDPFQNIEIINNMLIVHEYGGSNFRWAFDDMFKYVGNEFMLVNSKRTDYYTGTGNGYETEFDYINGNIKYSSCSFVDKKYIPKVIFANKTTEKYSFDLFDRRKLDNKDGFNVLPSLGWYEYSKYDKMLDLKINSNKALDLVKNTFMPDLEKVQIPWTSETKANYSSLLFYNVPDYYYKKDNLELYYFQLDDAVDGKLKHSIICKDDKNKITFYYVDDSTGEIKKN